MNQNEKIRDNYESGPRRLVNLAHFRVDGLLQRVTPDATQTPGAVAGLLKVGIVLNDDGVLDEEGVFFDVEGTLVGQLITANDFGFAAHSTAAAAALVRHIETANSISCYLNLFRIDIPFNQIRIENKMGCIHVRTRFQWRWRLFIASFSIGNDELLMGKKKMKNP